MAPKKAGDAAVSGFGPGSGMDDDVMGLSKGSRVWYKQDATTWVLAEMRDAPATPPEPEGPRSKKYVAAPAAAPITLLAGPDAGKPLDGVSVHLLMPANPEMQATIPDLTQLSYLNEPSILGNLQLRYSKDMIYTCAGPVLIALNPCKELPLYTNEVQHDYKSECFWEGAGGGAGALGGSPLLRQAAGRRSRGETTGSCKGAADRGGRPGVQTERRIPTTDPPSPPPTHAQPSRTSRCTSSTPTSTWWRARPTGPWCARGRARASSSTESPAQVSGVMRSGLGGERAPAVESCPVAGCSLLQLWTHHLIPPYPTLTPPPR
jgi:hypothetical protein